ncbi:carbon-nitrogen hydrolase family protein [Spirobacillus cienkowskii]|uniref:carbon-nitrogen hydrolase family protein n=1 Tax=Spirobacillus cienkowskii TaxID=495820 RepID=UPI0030D0FC78
MSSKKSLKVATVQFDPISGNFGYNSKVIAAFLEEAAQERARLVLFPELALSGYDLYLVEEGRCSVNESGAAINYLLNTCSRLQIYAVVGACIQRPDGLANGAFVINDKGNILGIYEKHYLDSFEKKFFLQGKTGLQFDVDSWKISIAISYDSQHPEHAKAMAKEDAAVYLVLGAFIKTGKELSHSSIFSTRAFDNTMYVAVSNFVGSHGELDFSGQSAIFDPEGQILCEGSITEPGIFYAELHESEILRIKNQPQAPIDIPVNPFFHK